MCVDLHPVVNPLHSFRVFTCICCSLEDGVRVQVNAAHVRWRVVKIEVARVHADNERTGGTQHISQGQGAQWNIWARPVEWENHLRRMRERECEGLLRLKCTPGIYDFINLQTPEPQ